MSISDLLHEKLVFPRRIQVLSKRLSEQMPQGASVLDVGSGDGSLAWLVQHHRPDIRIRGIDTLVRPKTQIPIDAYDGLHIPAPHDSFDVVMFVDVLHHTPDPLPLLAEASRVTRGLVVIKDHLRDGLFSNERLRWMDFVGNARHGVKLPYNYWKSRQWQQAFKETSLRIIDWNCDLGIYPWPVDFVFGGSLHFLGRLQKC